MTALLFYIASASSFAKYISFLIREDKHHSEHQSIIIRKIYLLHYGFKYPPSRVFDTGGSAHMFKLVADSRALRVHRSDTVNKYYESQ